ncbi:MAG: DsbA family protein [Conexibacter sp.]
MADSSETRKERRVTARADRDRAAAASAQKRQRLWILGGALALAAAVVVVIALASSGGSDKPKLKAGEQLPGQFEANARFAGIRQQGIELGNPKAPVTMVEFADLRCPYCRQYTEAVMPTLVANYVKTGKLRMIFRNVSILGSDSISAAQMAGAAGLQNKLWPYIDIFYANQGDERTAYVTEDFMRRIGRAVKGLNVDKAWNERGNAAVLRQITEAQTEFQANGFSGTPAFLVGPTGGKLEALSVQAFTPDQFTPAIDRLLASRS